MDSLSNPFNILILTSKANEAEAIVTSLRNGGLAVRGIYTDEPDRLEELTASHALDLILCCEYDPPIDLDDCMRHYAELDVDLPLIVIAGEETDSTSLIRALRAGARDLTEQRDTDHLQLVVAREIQDLQHRRMERHLRQRLSDCEQRAKDLIDASGEAVAFIQDGMHTQINPAYQRLFQFDAPEELDGYPLLDLIAEGDRPEARRVLRSLQRLDGKESEQVELECVRADTSRFRAQLTASRSNLDGEPCLRVTIKAAPEAPPREAPDPADPEPGFPNRAALMAELNARTKLDNPAQRPFAAVYIGMPGLPEILRRAGLTAGLEAASAFGDSLRALVPEASFLARFADDAFFLLVDDISHADAERLVAAIRGMDGSQPAGPSETPMCAAGLMLADPRSSTPAEILDTAYRAYLFSLSERGGDQSRTGSYQPAAGGGQAETGDDHELLAADITEALEGEGFQLVYQPIVSLKGDSQENYNVLLRLSDQSGSLREAKDFLDAAIQSGQMLDVDRWVIRHAIAEVAAKRSQGHKINFFINVAEETLQEEKLLIWICDCLRELQARGNWLTFQILEEHARRHTAAFTRLSDGLRKVKCRVALNRFGLTPNPEVLLEHLHPDFVKFAPEFSEGLADDEPKQRKLLKLTSLARDSGTRSVVTGIEDARSLTVLWSAGIDYVQGNFLQKPSPVIETQNHPA